MTCTAQDVSGYVFDHWEFCCGSAGVNPIPVTMNWWNFTTAHYTPASDVTVASFPVAGNGFVMVDGNPVTTPQNFAWAVGSNHALVALSPVSGVAGVQYVWTDWSDGGAQTHTYTTPSSPETVTAHYRTQYELTVGTDPAGLTPQPTVSPSGPWYDEGTVVTCTAQDVAGYVFDHWTVDDLVQAVGDNPIQIPMYAAHTATAHYIAEAEISLDPTCGAHGTRVDVSGSYFNRNIVGCIIESNSPELFMDSVCEVQYVDHVYATVSGYFDVADGASGEYTVTVVAVGPGQRASAGFKTDCPVVGGVVVRANNLTLVAPYRGCSESSAQSQSWLRGAGRDTTSSER